MVVEDPGWGLTRRGWGRARTWAAEAALEHGRL